MTSFRDPSLILARDLRSPEFRVCATASPKRMSQSQKVKRVGEILAAAKALAVEYYQLTGKPLGVTGEVAEYVAASTLRLKLASPRTPGHDATRRWDGK